MKYISSSKVADIKIAYIGGGSRGWAWGLMSDLVACDDISGDVYLYDIDFQAAKNNEIIGNKFNQAEGAKTTWNYKAVETIEEALTGADFIVISITPGTFDEMESDVHTPEKYGIYQSVGDTSGPGGIVRAMRAIPMFEEIGENIKKYAPNAWVINYTNPMTLCVKALYRVFPEIKAFGCCHEVFGTQKLLTDVLEEFEGISDVHRSEIKVNVIGVNHFTWLTEAKYKNIDLFPAYRKFAEKYKESGYKSKREEPNLNKNFICREKVKIDLFLRYGCIAAAGDRHLAEFCPGDWYLESPDMVENKWKFGLTPVSWRKDRLRDVLLPEIHRLANGEAELELGESGEEGVNQMRAILGLCELRTNVNIPNVGQIPNLPLGAIVETNAVFSGNSVQPVMAGAIPENILPLVGRVCAEQEAVLSGAMERNLEKVFSAFASDPLVRLPLDKARELFDEMVNNTKKYLTMYN